MIHSLKPQTVALSYAISWFSCVLYDMSTFPVNRPRGEKRRYLAGSILMPDMPFDRYVVPWEDDHSFSCPSQNPSGEHPAS